MAKINTESCQKCGAVVTSCYGRIFDVKNGTGKLHVCVSDVGYVEGIMTSLKLGELYMWIPFKGWHDESDYDIRLKDGRVWYSVRASVKGFKNAVDNSFVKFSYVTHFRNAHELNNERCDFCLGDGIGAYGEKKCWRCDGSGIVRTRDGLPTRASNLMMGVFNA